MIDFTGGTASPTPTGPSSTMVGQVLMLKSGEDDRPGSSTDIGGTSPLRLTFRTASGERDFSSNEVAAS